MNADTRFIENSAQAKTVISGCRRRSSRPNFESYFGKIESFLANL